MAQFQSPRRDYVFTSESVSEGHPDKVCDRISDSVVDAFLSADPFSRVACETLATTNRVILAGEVRGPKSVTKELLIEGARTGLPFSYCRLTWLLASGPSCGLAPEWRASASDFRMAWAYWIGAGISCGVSVQA